MKRSKSRSHSHSEKASRVGLLRNFFVDSFLSQRNMQGVMRLLLSIKCGLRQAMLNLAKLHDRMPSLPAPNLSSFNPRL